VREDRVSSGNSPRGSENEREKHEEDGTVPGEPKVRVRATSENRNVSETAESLK